MLGRVRRSARNGKIRCAINGLARMLGGVCTDFSPLTVDKSSASKTCNFSVAWCIGVCDQRLSFAVQKLCTGLPTKSVEKVGGFRGRSSCRCCDWERCGLTETHQGLDAVFQGLRTGLPTKFVGNFGRLCASSMNFCSAQIQNAHLLASAQTTIQPDHLFCADNQSMIISGHVLLKRSAADHDRTLAEGSGPPGNAVPRLPETHPICQPCSVHVAPRFLLSSAP